MPSASATRLYVEGGVVRCGDKAGRRKCKKVVMKGGRVVCENGHEFSLAELLSAAKQAGQVTLESFLEDFFTLQLSDPLAQYRGIDGLVILADHENEAALNKLNGENPLGLADGWCRQQMPAAPWSVQQLTKLVKLCKSKEWSGPPEIVDKYGLCRPVATFEPPRILGEPVTLARMYEWLGVAHDGFGPGSVRDNVQYSNLAIRENRNWALTSLSGGWRVYYQPTPFWVRRKTWADQQKIATDKFGLTIRTAPEYTWMMDLWRANDLPENPFWARTTTNNVDGWSVRVGFGSYGVGLYCDYNLGIALDFIGAAVEGVPLALVS